MNVYDFDNTVFKPDSSACFLLFCLRHHPRAVLKAVPLTAEAVVLYLKHGRKDAKQLKQSLFSFLNRLDNVEAIVDEFWECHTDHLQGWYLKQKQPDDLIISASPEFLVSEACRRLGIKHVMASRVDAKTGKYNGLNCYGAEKPKRFDEYFGESEREKIENFYSDSYSDAPLAIIAKKAYLIKDHAPTEWDHSKNREI